MQVGMVRQTSSGEMMLWWDQKLEKCAHGRCPYSHRHMASHVVTRVIVYAQMRSCVKLAMCDVAEGYI
jgi:hypothetical protein